MGMGSGCLHTPPARTDAPGIKIIPRVNHPDDPQAGQPAMKAAEYLKLARDLVAGGYFDAAATMLARLAPEERRTADFLFVSAEIARHQGRMDEALAFYRQCLASSPQSAEAKNGIGLVLMARDDAVGAAEVFAEALAMAPTRSDYSNNMGYALMAAGRYAEAVPHLERCIQLEPQANHAVNNLAICKGFTGDADGALALLLQYKSPAEAYNNMGVIFLIQDDKGAALEMFRKAVALDPDLEEAAVNLANALKQTD